MVDQVLVRDLLFGNRDGSDDPPPINTDHVHFEDILYRCRGRIVSTNNTPHRFSHVLRSENPGAAATASSGTMASNNTPNCFRDPEAVDCCVSVFEDISRAMALKFVIRSRPSRNGVGVIKMQEGNVEMEGRKRYNILLMLSHCKWEKWKQPRRRRHCTQQSELSVMKMGAISQGIYTIQTLVEYIQVFNHLLFSW